MSIETTTVMATPNNAANHLLEVIQRAHAGVMPEAALQEAVNFAKASNSGFHCPLVTAAGGLFWCSLNVECEGNQGKFKWNHNLWGVGTLGGGAGGGTLYTSLTMEELIKRTARCSGTITPVSVLATFHADDNTLLATLVAGGYFAPAYTFIGGGSGQWAKN
jgi:hypothetical protein